MSSDKSDRVSESDYPAMQLDRLLADATGCKPGTTRHQQQTILAQKLNEVHGEGSITVKGVAKWFERGRIPTKWLMRVAALPKKPLNLTLYA